ncbi:MULTISPECIES: 3'-5' exonuclease [Bacillus]|uniref:3'-5' exonuclease n=1 Tax=Bacillus TaxID=1386 RepID=UPI0003164324|nr:MULTISPECIES: 3'-5' exonuclease [Bacillus]
MDFVTIDFETANSTRSSICSVGIVQYKNGKIANEYYELVKPKNTYFHPINVSIHGITYEDVRNKSEFNMLWPEIHSLLENHLVIAHNAAFDMSCLRYVLDEYNAPYPNISYNCTLNISKAIWPGLPSYKLNDLSKKLGYRFDHHNALDDAKACGNILIHALNHTSSKDLTTMFEEYSIKNGIVYPEGYKSPTFKKGKSRNKA